MRRKTESLIKILRYGTFARIRVSRTSHISTNVVYGSKE